MVHPGVILLLTGFMETTPTPRPNAKPLSLVPEHTCVIAVFSAAG
jgi:hypothetical protein